jgi:hypothetical protein
MLLRPPFSSAVTILQRIALLGLATVAMDANARCAFGAESLNQSALVTKHCLDCHAGDSAEGGLDLESLGGDLTDRALFAKWERVFDRVQLREMPPPSADQPTDAERSAFLRETESLLTKAHASHKGTVLRRLNRREYENTVNDIFGTNLKLAERLPEDGRSHEFDNVGETLSISAVQMHRYLECADAVLDAAIAQRLEPLPSKIVRASYADTRGAEEWLGKVWLKRDDGAVVFFKAFGYPSGMLREANT